MIASHRALTIIYRGKR